MKKQTKLFSTLSAAALLTIGVSAVSMAAGWDNSTGVWRYLNNDGTEVTDTWKSANGNWFYLNSDGEMATNQLIEDNNNSTTRYYYVDQYGAMVKNTWKAVAKDGDDDLDAEYWWYYFGSDGKAYTTKNDSNFTVSKLKTINGQKYAFNDEGHMLYGWIKEDSQEQNDNDDDAWKDALFFANGWNDGHIQTGWAQITVEDNDETKEYWFYFGNDGKKQFNKKKKINGVYYHFADDGHMLTDWAVGTTSVEDVKSGKTPNATPGDIVYLNGDGSERKNKWVWAVPDEHSEEISAVLQKDYDDDEYSWFYYDKSGKVTANKIRKINGKDYAFDAYGRMVIGFVAQNDDKSIVALKKPGDYTREEYLETIKNENKNFKYSVDEQKGSLADGFKLYYFSNDEEKDGSKKKGYQTLSLDDTTAQFYFNTSSGVAENGYVSKIKKYAINGLVLTPSDDDDSNYAGVTGTYGLNEKGEISYDSAKFIPDGIKIAGDIPDAEETTGAILVNKSGSIVKNKAKLKDNSDHYYIVNKNGIVLKKFDSESDYDDFVKYTVNDKEKKATISSTALAKNTYDKFVEQVAKDNKGWNNG